MPDKAGGVISCLTGQNRGGDDLTPDKAGGATSCLTRQGVSLTGLQPGSAMGRQWPQPHGAGGV